MVQFDHKKINNGCLILSSLPLEQQSVTLVSTVVYYEKSTVKQKKNLFRCQKAHFTKWHGVVHGILASVFHVMIYVSFETKLPKSMIKISLQNQDMYTWSQGLHYRKSWVLATRQSVNSGFILPMHLAGCKFFSLNKMLCEMKILNPTYVHIHQYQ